MRSQKAVQLVEMSLQDAPTTAGGTSPVIRTYEPKYPTTTPRPGKDREKLMALDGFSAPHRQNIDDHPPRSKPPLMWETDHIKLPPGQILRAVFGPGTDAA
tara:strand:- start:100 stop:402 length:303 start_codon:yes stop_codon:yes gene_type:complete